MPISDAIIKILEVLHQGGHLATTDPEAALTALQRNGRDIIAGHMRGINRDHFTSADVTRFFHWVFGSAPVADKLGRAPAVQMAGGIAESLVSNRELQKALAALDRRDWRGAEVLRQSHKANVAHAKETVLAEALAILGESDWRKIFIETLLALPAAFVEAPESRNYWGAREPRRVNRSFTVLQPAAVFSTSYGENRRSVTFVGCLPTESRYDNFSLELRREFGEPFGLEYYQSILDILRTDDRVISFLKESVDVVMVRFRSGSRPHLYSFAVSDAGHLVDLTYYPHPWTWRRVLSLMKRSESESLAQKIVALAASHRLAATVDTFMSGIRQFNNKHDVVFVGGDGDQPMAQVTFHQTTDGQMVVFLDQATRFDHGLMQPNMHKFFIGLFGVIPRGTKVRGNYQDERGDKKIGVWHWPEGEQFPQEYFFPIPEQPNLAHERQGPVADNALRVVEEPQVAAPVVALVEPVPLRLVPAEGQSASPTKKDGGEENPEASTKSIVVGRQPTDGVHEVGSNIVGIDRTGGVVAGIETYITEGGAVRVVHQDPPIADPEVVVNPQPLLHLVRDDEADDVVGEEAANTDVEAADDADVIARSIGDEAISSSTPFTIGTGQGIGMGHPIIGGTPLARSAARLFVVR